MEKIHLLSGFNKMIVMKDPDEIFNILMSEVYHLGIFGGGKPVDECRLVFQHIKKLLQANEKQL